MTEPTIIHLKRRTHSEKKAYFEGFNFGLEMAARRLEGANDETSRICLIEAIRQLKMEKEY